MRWYFAVGLILVAASGVALAQQGEEGFVPLFNGKDLTGWRVLGAPSWKAENGELVCHAGGGGWIRTEKEYEDFVLRLEYKVSPKGNSGVYLRSTEQGNPSFNGMELQVLDDYGRVPDKHTSMALYAAVAPSRNVSQPAGEWNQVEVSLIGTALKVVHNRETIIDCKLDDPTIDTEGQPKLMDRAKRGYLGMQDYGNDVAYRNVRIKVVK